MGGYFAPSGTSGETLERAVKSAKQAAAKDVERRAKMGAKPSATPESKPKQTAIGTNADGNPLFEDERGVRSFVRNGVRLTESVGMAPKRGGGMEVSVDKGARTGEYLTEQERADRAKVEKARASADAANAQQAAELEQEAAKPEKTAWRNPEAFIRIAADDVSALRKADVERVIREAPAQSREMLGDYIAEKRPDLAEEVRDVQQELAAPAAPVAAPVTAPAPSKNRLVTDERAAELRERLKAKLNLNQLNSDIDPEILAIGAELAVHHIEKGARRFNAFARAIANDLGAPLASIRQYLRGWYNGARDMMEDMGESVAGMDDANEVGTAMRTFDQWANAEPVTGATNAGTGENNVGPSIYQDGAGPLAGVPANDVSRPESSGNAEPARAGSQQGGSRAGSQPDGERNAEAGSRGDGATRPDNAATGGKPRVGKKPKAAALPKPKTPTEQALTGPNEAIEKASPINVPGIDFVITDDVQLGQGTEGVKYQDNITAIETLKKIEAENRRASPAEQRRLARYVGWGGLKNAFRVAGSKDGEGVAKGWEKRVSELEELLTPAELKAARNSTTAAHYTSQTVVEATWKAAERIGFAGGSVLEPSVGTGNFLGLMPQGLRPKSKVFAVEYDSLTARIAQSLYPNAAIVHSGLQEFQRRLSGARRV
nr:hypothetical protein [Novosphingobium sp. AAP83]